MCVCVCVVCVCVVLVVNSWLNRRVGQSCLSPRFTPPLFSIFSCVNACLVSLTCAGAVLVDKDNNPAWKYGSVDEVPRDVVTSFFETTPDGVTDLDLTD